MLPFRSASADLLDLGMPFAGHLFLFRPAILTAIDLSLKRLGVDSIDLYMVCLLTWDLSITEYQDSRPSHPSFLRIDGQAISHCV